MTKREAETHFRANHVPAILEQEAQSSGRVDEPLRSFEWNTYTDMLCKDGQITEHQRANWDFPRWLFSSRLQGGAS